MGRVPIGHFDGHANLTRGQRRSGAPILEEVVNELYNPTARSLYVDQNHTATFKSGSIVSPYTDIQSAIDKQEEDASLFVGPSPINISPGWYREKLIIHKAGLCLFGGSGGQRFVTVTPPSGLGGALILTNATPASLVTYESSGDYADLINQGDGGPYEFFASGINFFNWFANDPDLGGVSLWGVKGDAGGGDETFFAQGHDGINFGKLFSIGPIFFGCSMWSLRGRNVGGLILETCDVDKINLHNFKNVTVLRSDFRSHDLNVLDYDVASIYGQPAGGHQQIGMKSCDIVGSLSVLGSVDFAQSGSYPTSNNRITETVAFNTTGNVYLSDWMFEDDVSFADGVVATMKNCWIGGDLICDPGAGAITKLGGRYMGSLSDPNGRLTHTQGNIGT